MSEEVMPVMPTTTVDPGYVTPAADPTVTSGTRAQRSDAQPLAATCQQGGHFFTRDYVLGVFPVGRPYCMWCGEVAQS